MSTKELGVFKDSINKALFADKDIITFLCGDTTGKKQSEVIVIYKKHVKSHLFVEDTLQDSDSYIFYDVTLPNVDSQIKQYVIYMYLVCSRNVIDDISNYAGYIGNRADLLAQLVEHALILDEDVANKFGIGKLQLQSVDIYNAKDVCGRILTFTGYAYR